MPIMLNEQDTVACGNTQDCQHSALSEEHTSELQSPCNLVCRLLLEKKKKLIQRSARSSARHDVQVGTPPLLSPCPSRHSTLTAPANCPSASLEHTCAYRHLTPRVHD